MTDIFSASAASSASRDACFSAARASGSKWSSGFMTTKVYGHRSAAAIRAWRLNTLGTHIAPE